MAVAEEVDLRVGNHVVLEHRVAPGNLRLHVHHHEVPAQRGDFIVFNELFPKLLARLVPRVVQDQDDGFAGAVPRAESFTSVNPQDSISPTIRQSRIPT